MHKPFAAATLVLSIGACGLSFVAAQNTDGLSPRQKLLLEQAQKKKAQRAETLMAQIRPMLASGDPRRVRTAVIGLRKVVRLYGATPAGAEAQKILDRLQAEAERKAKIEKLGRRYRLEKNPEKRQEFFDQLMEMGPEGREHLAELTRRELDRSLDRYGAKFKKSAVAEVAKRRKAADGGKMRAAQRKITSLDGKVTKETIVRVADPALAELSEALVPKLEEVIGADEQLQALRQEVIDASGPWRKATGLGAEDLLAEQERAMVLVALVYPNGAQARILLQNAELGAGLDRSVTDGIHETNRRRILAGLNPLLIDLKLCAAAEDHSRDMVRLNFFSHTSPVKGKEHFTQRAANFKTTSSAENIAAGQRSGEEVIQVWWHSPGHFANLMGRHRRIGLGRHRNTWTQMFGR
ncbi:MAG: CAP domain-containing protein [Phycisphaeraceae bacterium]|nr:CAP domain-containing protein [Phycisphaeraceae bacterium]